jgi:hypothetical protein
MKKGAEARKSTSRVLSFSANFLSYDSLEIGVKRWLSPILRRPYVKDSHMFHIPVRSLSLENKVIHPQRIAGGQTIGCHHGRTPTQGFRPFDNLVKDDPVQNLDRGKEGYKSGEDQKEEDKDGELEPDGSKHVENPLYWVNSPLWSKMGAKEPSSIKSNGSQIKSIRNLR